MAPAYQRLVPYARMLGFPRGFRTRLALIGVATFIVRALYVLVIAPDRDGLGGDGFFYHKVANRLADGGGYESDETLVSILGDGGVVLTAEHGPLWPFVLSLTSLLGGTSYTAHRLTQCAVGAVAVVAIGLLGRRVGGARTGLVAATISAGYPILTWTDGSLMSETVYGIWVVAILLLAYRLMERPSAGRAAALGAAIGLAALTRVEAFLFLPLVALPAAVAAGRRRLPAIALTCVAVAVVVAPWTIRNWSVFDRPVLVSTNSGPVLAGSNCEATYRFGPDLGRWRRDCISRPRYRNEAAQSARWRREGLDYAGEHLDRLPLVLSARVLRTWNFAPLAATEGPEGEVRMLQLGIVAYYPLLGLAFYGLVQLRRRGHRLFVLAGPALVVTVATIVGHGYMRFRHAAEISIVVLAAVAFVQLLDTRLGPGQPATDRALRGDR
jgi:hypothetical protein